MYAYYIEYIDATGPDVIAVWCKALPLTASCPSPLSGFGSRPAHMRKCFFISLLNQVTCQSLITNSCLPFSTFETGFDKTVYIEDHIPSKVLFFFFIPQQDILLYLVAFSFVRVFVVKSLFIVILVFVYFIFSNQQASCYRISVISK